MPRLSAQQNTTPCHAVTGGTYNIQKPRPLSRSRSRRSEKQPESPTIYYRQKSTHRNTQPPIASLSPATEAGGLAVYTVFLRRILR